MQNNQTNQPDEKDMGQKKYQKEDQKNRQDRDVTGNEDERLKKDNDKCC